MLLLGGVVLWASGSRQIDVFGERVLPLVAELEDADRKKIKFVCQKAGSLHGPTGQFDGPTVAGVTLKCRPIGIAVVTDAVCLKRLHLKAYLNTLVNEAQITLLAAIVVVVLLEFSNPPVATKPQLLQLILSQIAENESPKTRIRVDEFFQLLQC